MEIIVDRIKKIDDAIEATEPGTEEYERLTNAQANLVKANAEDKKADSDVEMKKQDVKKAILVAAIPAGFLFVGGLVRDILKFIMNKDVVNGERNNGEFYQHNPYDNR